ncbi:MAG: HAD family phosphatase [Candidatus Woesearchaeota archaeon]
MKAVLFDAGGVLVDFADFGKWLFDIFKPQDQRKFWEEINILCLPLCRGEVTLEDFWQQLRRKYKIQLDDSSLHSVWVEKFANLTKINRQVLDIALSLKPRYQIGIISNTIPQHAEIHRTAGLYDMFDVVLLSSELQMTKDDERIFLLAAEMLNVLPQECVFIDDVKLFVNKARSVGMTGILYEGPEKLAKSLQGLGLS